MRSGPKRSAREQSPPIGRGAAGNSPLLLFRQPRRRHVNRFFEIRPVQRVGLVEKREDPQAASFDQPFERDFGAGNKALDQEAAQFAPARHLQLR